MGTTRGVPQVATVRKKPLPGGSGCSYVLGEGGLRRYTFLAHTPGCICFFGQLAHELKERGRLTNEEPIGG